MVKSLKIKHGESKCQQFTWWGFGLNESNESRIQIRFFFELKCLVFFCLYKFILSRNEMNWDSNESTMDHE